MFFTEEDWPVLFFREVFVEFFPPAGRLRRREEDRAFRFFGVVIAGEEDIFLVALLCFAEEESAATLPLGV